ncbi:MAG: TonB-dependent receptor, partial [Calditrichales bacterium]
MKNRFSIIFLCVLFLFLSISSVLLAGTTGKIVGMITDAQTGEPIPGVNILVDGTYLGAASDLDGYYLILNVPAGEYTVKATMIGYKTSAMLKVRINIDQTTEINFTLSEETLEISETIEVIADRPIVERDVAGSRVNLNFSEVEAMPVVSVANVIGLQAGVEGMSIRDGYLSEVAFMVDGMTLRDERDNSPYTGISYTAIEDIQVQAGGFSAEFGNIRSGIVNIVTKEGKRQQYDFSFLGRYSPKTAKHFGPSPNAPGSYWVRPYLDPQVAFDGTKNWDEFTRKQYPEFMGFNALSEKLLTDDNPDNDMTPQQLQQLFLFEHRRQLDINAPDYSYDMSFGGPVPVISEQLGNLRFHTSYRSSQNMYIMPVSDDGYRDYNWQLKLNSDIDEGMKLMIEGLIGRETGSSDNNSGLPGIFKYTYEIPGYIDGGFSYADGATFGTDYWSLAAVDYSSIGAKLTHALSPKSYYEASLHSFSSSYSTNPGGQRNRDKVYQFGTNFYVDEAPYGWEPSSPDASIVTGMNMGTGFANSRDSSKVTTYAAKFDFASQMDRFNFIKTGFELNVTNSQVNYARYDPALKAANNQTKWDRTPVRGAIYITDKLEFEEMVAQIGLRLDYSHAGGEWYVYDPFNKAFSGAQSSGIDTLLEKEQTKHVFTLSPRLAIAFPITEDSKLYFNYGHFRQLPSPENLYLLRRSDYYNSVSRIASPNNPLPKTVAYELGYEHNISDQFLLRAAGYYKDVSEEPQLVSYVNSDGSVNYSASQPYAYRDIRGFEISLNKNRGNWIRGFLNYTYMVSSSGQFGLGRYYESPADQRDYLLGAGRTYHYQSKPIPRPFARANIDLFTPADYGPNFSGIDPLANWR